MDYILALIISLFGGQASDYAISVNNDVADVKYVGSDTIIAGQSESQLRGKGQTTVYLNNYVAYKGR